MTKLKALIITMVAFNYYLLLAAKQYTWIFASGDSGDWLTSSTLWIVPQPYGSPLYISLGHLVNLLPGNLATNMTVLLSVLPAAITVGLIYLIVRHLTKKEWVAVTCSVVLLGAAIPLSQATILEEYSIAVMFITLAYLMYLYDKKWATALCLGLGTAIHVIVLVIALLWFAANARKVKDWLKVTPIYIVSGVCPYILILYLMAHNTAPFNAGGLSLQGLVEYIGTTSTVASLSLADAPRRMLSISMFTTLSLGLALIPTIKGFKRPWSTSTLMAMTTIVFIAWFCLTTYDPTQWTFLAFGLPMAIVLCGLGLSKMESHHIRVVLVGAGCLILANGFFLNANAITSEKNEAMRYYESVMNIPDGSVVIIHHGWAAQGLNYAMVNGKNVIPIFTKTSDGEDVTYQHYADWMKDKFNLIGKDTKTLTQDALNKGVNTYIFDYEVLRWSKVFNTEDTNIYRFKKVTAVNMEAKLVDTTEVIEWNPIQALIDKLKGH